MGRQKKKKIVQVSFCRNTLDPIKVVAVRRKVAGFSRPQSETSDDASFGDRLKAFLVVSCLPRKQVSFPTIFWSLLKGIRGFSLLTRPESDMVDASFGDRIQGLSVECYLPQNHISTLHNNLVPSNK